MDARNGLVLNSSKTKFMVFSKQQQSVHAVLENKPIRVHGDGCDENNCRCDILEEVRSYRYLGLILQSDLKYNLHIESLRNKLRASVAILSRLRSIASVKLNKILYFSLIESHLNYMLTVYGGTFRTRIKSLTILQKKAVRCIVGADRFAHSEPIFKKLSILDFNRLYLHKILKHMIAYSGFYHHHKPQHGFNTRFRLSGSLTVPRHTTETLRRTFSTHFVSIYNILPAEMKDLYDNLYVISPNYVDRKIKLFISTLPTQEIDGVLR